ncbi:MAG: hypothetical protein GF404_00895 [candidate division Zixibacteria bacterium]|nr:hypothetical protein [candidate division Zixibacteria bacterium]
MPVSNSFADFVIDQLAGIGRINGRRMFGGMGIYCDGLFFALIADDVLYFKVDDSNLPDFEKIGAKPFQPYGEEGQTMSYYEILADILEDRDELAVWAEKAIAVAGRAKKK